MKQLTKQPPSWFVLCLTILLFPSVFFSYDYDESPTVKITFIDYTHNPNKPKLSFGMRIRPIESTSTYSEQSNVLPNWSNTSAENFQEYFQDIKPEEILENYELYSLAEFRAFLKTLLDYKKHILEKHKELFKRSGFTHFWAKLWSAVRGTTSPSHVQIFIEKMHDELVKKEEQIKQLHYLYSTYKDFQPSHIKHSQLVSQRMYALQQSLDKDLQHSFVKSNWFDVDPIFIDTFNLDSNMFDLNGTPVQHVLQKEFHAIAQGTVQAWIHHKNNGYIQQLVEKNVICIKSGITHNQSGDVVEAACLADIGWAILDHIQALGEGVLQGVDNVAQAFLHPVDTVQGTAKGIAQCGYYLGQATLEAIDLSILAVTDQNVACKKLQTWKQHFIKLTDTINEQWQVTSNRDITKFISRFTTEVFLTGKIFGTLGGLFSFARINGTKLISKAQKAIESVSQVTTSEGIITYINKGVKYTQRTSKTGHVVKVASQVKSIIKKITTKEAKKIAKKLGFNKTNYYSHGQAVFKKENIYITLDLDSHNGGVWKMADSVKNLGGKKSRIGSYDINLNRIGD